MKIFLPGIASFITIAVGVLLFRWGWETTGLYISIIAAIIGGIWGLYFGFCMLIELIKESKENRHGRMDENTKHEKRFQ